MTPSSINQHHSNLNSVHHLDDLITMNNEASADITPVLTVAGQPAIERARAIDFHNQQLRILKEMISTDTQCVSVDNAMGSMYSNLQSSVTEFL